VGDGMFVARDDGVVVGIVVIDVGVADGVVVFGMNIVKVV
jgi:hypothetical protein